MSGILDSLRLAAFSLFLPLALQGAATITIVNADAPGVGFNDPTPVAPIGGNTGTTLGQQRLIAFQAAADKWGATVTSSIPIRVRAMWTALTCNATSAVLGSAGPAEIWKDFANAPVAGHWYGKALANALAGTETDAGVPDITANFNVNLGNSGCLTGHPFYLGLDNNHGSTRVDLIAVLTHELAHGLGFLTFSDGQTGKLLGGTPSIMDDFLLDTTTNKTWTMMTDSERINSAINTGHLVWNGGGVTSAIPQVLQPSGSVFRGTDTSGRGLMYAPSRYQSGSSVSHWDTSMTPNQLMEPAINGDLTHEVSPPQDLTLLLLKDIGWNATTILPPNLTITKQHSGSFTQGQTGATYSITVSNTGSGLTRGTVTVSDAIPFGLTATTISGPGWICAAPAGPCTRSDVLASGASYPPLTVFVNVAANAPASVTNTATVSGGGADTRSASDLTVITAVNPPGPGLSGGVVVTQSSTLAGYPSAVASSAFDGNTDGNFFHSSVTATNFDTNAWWQVDLGDSKPIASVVIWNRTDCCGTRLNDYWLFVSNTPFSASDTPATLQGRAGTFASHQTTAPGPSATILTGSIQGRYVRVQLSGANYLSLAEVQVLSTVVTTPSSNLLAGKPVSQSSTYPGIPSAAAASAIDGNTDGNFNNASVTATNFEANPWWQADLGSAAAITSVAIWNRTDCCSSRLADYWIFVSNTPFSDTDTPATLQNRAGTFASHQTTAPGPSTVIPFSAQGRYLRVQLSTPGYLSLAEVQAFGTPGSSSLSNLAVGKQAAQSSTLAGYATTGAARAVDGNVDGLFFDGSVTSTNADTNAWWQVDLTASASVSSVVIWNRTDCCGTRLNDYWVFVSDTPFSATDTPATLQNRAGTFASHQTTAPGPSATIPVAAPGRYVRVQLNGINYLSLAEVQVFGQ